MQISIKTNFPQVQRALDELQAGVREAALVSAINKTLDQAKTAMVRGIASEFNVKAAYVRERLRVIRASKKGGPFTIVGTLQGGSDRKRSANIIAFVERSTSLAQARKRRKGGTLNQLYVKIKRGSGAKPLKGAFIGNEGRTVFKRTGKARPAIEPVQVIDVSQMFNTRRINSVVVVTMKAKFPQIFEREARFYLNRFNQQR